MELKIREKYAPRPCPGPVPPFARAALVFPAEIADLVWEERHTFSRELKSGAHEKFNIGVKLCCMDR